MRPVWKVSPLVGTDPDYPDVTPRDAEALRELKAEGLAAKRLLRKSPADRRGISLRDEAPGAVDARAHRRASATMARTKAPPSDPADVRSSL